MAVHIPYLMRLFHIEKEWAALLPAKERENMLISKRSN